MYIFKIDYTIKSVLSVCVFDKSNKKKKKVEAIVCVQVNVIFGCARGDKTLKSL